MSTPMTDNTPIRDPETTRNEVAELSGPRWTAFLDASADTQQFSSGMGRVLGDERFSRSFNFDPPALRLAAEHWIEVQRRKPIPGSTSLRERVSRIASISDTWGTSGVGAAGPRSALAANAASSQTDNSLLKPLPQERPLRQENLEHADRNQGQAQ